MASDSCQGHSVTACGLEGLALGEFAGQEANIGVCALSDSLFASVEPEGGAQRTVAESPLCRWGVKSAQGQRPNMEDAYSVHDKLSTPQTAALCSIATDSTPGSQHDSPTVSDSISVPFLHEDLIILSVFDGHGGSEVAEHCRDKLHKHFACQLSLQRLGQGNSTATNGQEGGLESSAVAACHGHDATLEVTAANLQASKSDSPAAIAALQNLSLSAPMPYPPELVTEALRASFLKTDEELAGTDEGDYVGATAVVAVVGKEHIWVAHCGDSRAVIQRGAEAIALTNDHKPDREDEAARIRQAGGRIVFNSGSHRVMGMLAMSRAIGDHFLRPYVIADPEISCVERTANDELLLLATDGLWDVFNCKEATTLAMRCINRAKERGMSRHGSCRVAAAVLTKVALERGSRDNITVIVIDITKPTEPEVLAAGSSDSILVPSSSTRNTSASGAAPGGPGGGAPKPQNFSVGAYYRLKGNAQQPGLAQQTPGQGNRHLDRQLSAPGGKVGTSVADLLSMRSCSANGAASGPGALAVDIPNLPGIAGADAARAAPGPSGPASTSSPSAVSNGSPILKALLKDQQQRQSQQHRSISEPCSPTSHACTDRAAGANMSRSSSDSDSSAGSSSSDAASDSSVPSSTALAEGVDVDDAGGAEAELPCRPVPSADASSDPPRKYFRREGSGRRASTPCRAEADMDTVETAEGSSGHVVEPAHLTI